MTSIPRRRDGALTIVFVLALAVAVFTAGCSSTPDGDVSEAVAPPPVANPTPPPIEKPMLEHKVIQGDSLWKLAMDYDTSVAEIKQANNLETDLIKTGDKLLIPTFKSPTVGAATAAVTGTVTPGEGTQPIEGAPSAPPSVSLSESQPPRSEGSAIPSDVPFFREGSKAKTGSAGPVPSEINVPPVVPQ